MLRKIAIIGANGFVGRHLVELLVQRGVQAVGVVRSDRGAETVRRLGGSPVLVPDLTERGLVPLAGEITGCDALVYTASVSTGPSAPDRTEPAGVANVMRVCHAAGVPRFAFLSGLGIAHYGMNPHCTNRYFLSKMAGEVALFRSPLSITVFRPSYIFGAGDEFLSPLIERLKDADKVEIPGDGLYRMQPVSIRDAARAILGSVAQDAPSPRVVDLVGPEILSYRDLTQRLAALLGRRIRVTERPVVEAQAAAHSTGYFGLRPHDLACLLCDQVSDSHAVERLTGGALEPLDSVLSEAIRSLVPSASGA